MNKGDISAKKLKKFRRLLLAKQNEVLQDASFSEPDKSRRMPAELSDTPDHTVDSGAGGLGCDKVNRFKHGGKRLLASIADALARIDAGTYGICDGDGELIAKSRLETVPWTRYCAKCARLAQMGLLRSEDSFEGSDNNE